MTNLPVRAAAVKDALRFAPKPFGVAKPDGFAGLFFDIECTAQPCPWLATGQPAGLAAFFSELRTAWPTVVLSLYVSGNPGVRISAAPNSAAETYPFEYAAGPFKAAWGKGVGGGGAPPTPQWPAESWRAQRTSS